MSQVKKLQGGGNTKLGSLTIDGTRYDATPEMIQALSDYLRPSSSATVNLAGINAALRNGANLVYDSLGNTISGMSGKWTGVSDKQDQKRTSGDDNDFNRALRLLSSFSYTAPKKKGEEISGNKIFFEYGDNGEYLPNSGINNSIFDRISKIGRHLSDEASGKYEFASKYTPAQIDAIRSLYNKYGGWASLESHANDVMSRAKQGRDKLTADDLAFLKTFNIAEGVDEDENGDSTYKKAKAITSDDWKKWGFGTGDANDKLYQQLKGKVVLNDDGSLSLVEGADWGLDDYSNGNYYFNDDFYTYAKGASKYNPFKGLTLFENRLYSNASKGLSDILNREDGYNAAIQRGDFVGAQNYIKTNWRPGELFNPGVIDSGSYLPDFTSPSIRINNVTGLKTVNGMLPGQQLVQTIDLAAPDVIQGNPYRQYTYKYSLLDEYGKKIRDVADNEVTDVIGGQSAGDIRAYKLLSGINPRSKYANRFYYDYVAAGDEDGKESPLRAYISKSDPNDIIMQMDGLDDNVIIPKEIAQLLFSNPNFVNKLSNLDAQGMANLKEFLRSLQDPSKRFFHTYLFDPEWWSDSNWSNVAKSFGLSKEEMLQLKQLVEKEKNQTNRYSISKPVIRSQKNGGILKNQKGGVAGGSTQTKGVSERIVDTQKFYNPKNAAGITEAKILGGDGKNWTDADTADVVALGADLGSLGLAFAPGANVASAGVGAAGSFARFKADLDRGTGGAGWNLALNLGMDAATLLPLLGGAAKGVKVANAVRKSASTLIKLASIAGLGSAFASTVNKIASGEKFTARDISTIVNGVTAGIGVIKSGGFGKGTKKNGGFEEISIKGKKGEGVDLSGQNVTIKKNDLGADFDGLSVADKQKRIVDVALAQMRTKSGKTDLTAEQLAKAVENHIPTEWTGTDIVITGKRSTNAGLADGDIKLTSKDIETITNSKNEKAELEKIIADKVRAKTGNTTMSDEDALKNVDLSQFSKQNWWRRKILPGKGWMKKKDKFDFNPTEKEGTSAYTPEEIAKMKVFKRWWNGLGTNRMLYNRRMRGEGVFDLVPVPEKMPSWRDPKFRTVQRVLHEQYIPGPTDSGNIITATNYPALNRTLFRNAQSEVRGRNREAMDQFGKLLKRYENTHIFVPQWVHWLTDANYQENQYQTPAGFAPLYVTPYKKGGKIAKAQPGLKTFKTFNTELELPDYTKVESTPNYVMKSGPNSQTDLFTGKTTINTPGIADAGENWDAKTQNTTNAFNTATESLKRTNPSLYYQMKANELSRGVTGNVSTTLDSEDDLQGGFIKPKTYANFDFSRPLDIINAGLATNDINKQEKTTLDYLNRYNYGHAYHEDPTRFVSSGKGDSYREAAKRALSVPIVKTSDAMRTDAMYRNRFGDYNKYMTQGDLEDSLDRSRYIASVDETNRNNAKYAYNFEEQKRNEKNKIEGMKSATEASAIGQRSVIRDNLFKGFEQDATKAFQNRAQNIFYDNADKLYADYNDWQRIYNNIADKNSPQALNAANKLNEIGSALRGLQYKASQQGIFRVKKGGKTNYHKSEFSRDPIPEIMIENTKAAHRFAEKLSIETLRMLSKIKPFHVS